MNLFLSRFGNVFRVRQESPAAADKPLLMPKGLPFESRFSAALEKGYAQARAVLDFADARLDQVSSLPTTVSCILDLPEERLGNDQKTCLLFSLLTKGFDAPADDLQRCLSLLIENKRTYFEFSSEKRHEECFFYAILNACLNQGVPYNVTLEASCGDPMIFWFANQKYWAVVSCLLDRGADPNAQNVKGLTLLHMICKVLNEPVSPFRHFDEVYNTWFPRKVEGFAAIAQGVPVPEVDAHTLFERLLPLTNVTLKSQAGETAFSLANHVCRANILQAYPTLVLEGTAWVDNALVSLAGEALLRLDYALLEKLLEQNPQALVTPDETSRLPTWMFWSIADATRLCHTIDFLKSKSVWKTTIEYVTPSGETFLTYGLSQEKKHFRSEKHNQLLVKLERLTTELPTHAWVEVAPNGESASFWLHSLEAHVPGLMGVYVQPRRAAILEASLQHVAREFGPPKARF